MNNDDKRRIVAVGVAGLTPVQQWGETDDRKKAVSSHQAGVEMLDGLQQRYP
jgi:hypothetical protein